MRKHEPNADGVTERRIAGIYAFRDTLPAIKSPGPIICVDLPGFGRSESRPDVMAPEAMGGFVVKLADHLGINRMHAVGPDVGTSPCSSRPSKARACLRA